MRFQFFGLGLCFVVLCGACQNSQDALLNGTATTAVSDSRGRLFDVSCLQAYQKANGPITTLPQGCQIAYVPANNATSSQAMVASRGMMSPTDTGWVNGTTGGGTYTGTGFSNGGNWVNGYTGASGTGYNVYTNPATFGQSGCQYFTGMSNCYNAFGYNGEPPSSVINPSCGSQYLSQEWVNGTNGATFGDGNCGTQYWNGQSTAPMPPYATNWMPNYYNGTTSPAGQVVSGSCSLSTGQTCNEQLYISTTSGSSYPTVTGSGTETLTLEDNGCLSPYPITGIIEGSSGSLGSAGGVSLVLNSNGNGFTGTGTGMNGAPLNCTFQ